MISFLSSSLILQDSQEEIESEMEEGEKNVKGEICKKIKEGGKIHEETEEGEDELEEEEENYEEEEENEDMDDDGVEEGRNEMGFEQSRYAEESGYVDSGGRSSCSTGPHNGDVSSADTQKVSCADASLTWCKLLNEFNVLMKSLKGTNDVSRLVQLLQSMHSIIRCATEVTVLLENNCHCCPDETPFITTFFGDYFGDMIRLLVQVLATLSYEDEVEEVGECVILMCLEMVGSVLHMPESRYALKQDIEAAVTVLSLPWHREVPPGSDMNHSLLSLVTQLTALSSKFSNYVTFINE